jgi:RTC4-like domain
VQILAPEIAVFLIGEDMKVDIVTARTILEESNDIGSLLNAADE